MVEFFENMVGDVEIMVKNAFITIFSTHTTMFST